MDKGAWFALSAPVVYALANVILDYRLSKFNQLTLIIVYASMVVVMATTVRYFTKDGSPAYDFPMGTELVILAGVSVLWFLGDYFFIGAYHNGASLATVTIFMSTFPVFASIFRLIGSRIFRDMTFVVPNAWLICGYVLFFVALLCIIKGTMVPTDVAL